MLIDSLGMTLVAKKMFVKKSYLKISPVINEFPRRVKYSCQIHKHLGCVWIPETVGSSNFSIFIFFPHQILDPNTVLENSEKSIPSSSNSSQYPTNTTNESIKDSKHVLVSIWKF